MIHYKVERYQENNFLLWNNFILECKNATFLFNRNFMEYHKNRFYDYSLLIFKNDKLLAVLPANEKDNQLYSHQGLSYGGLIYNQTLKFDDVLQVFKSILCYLDAKGIHSLHLKLLPPIYSGIPNEEMRYLMFILKAELTRRDILSVINYQELPSKISKIRQRGVKKAKSLGLTIVETSKCDDFWNSILIPNLKERFGTSPVHTLDEITKLKANFPKNIRQFNVYKEGEIVAGTTIFETKKVAHAQYISANETRQETGALDYLFEYLIFEVFRHKSYFDFGISNENQGKHINKGLLYWKESFGARTITTDFYSLQTKHYIKLDAVMV